MSIFEDIGSWYSVKENLPPNFKLGSCWNNCSEKNHNCMIFKDFSYVYWELWTNWNVCILILKTTTWIFRSLLSILRSMCKLKCLSTDHRISIMKEFLEAHEKKKSGMAIWQLCSSSLGTCWLSGSPGGALCQGSSADETLQQTRPCLLTSKGLLWSRELCSMFCDNLDANSTWKRMGVCTRIPESLSYTPETNTAL